MTIPPRSPKYLAGIASAVVGLLGAPAVAAAAQPAPATGFSVAPPAASVRAVRVGAVPRGRRIDLELPLKIDTAGLARFAASVSTPGSPVYGRYASVPALARRFGAPASERARVVRYLRGAGANGVAVAPTGLYVSAQMRVGTAQKLFRTTLAEFHSDAVRGVPATRFISPTARSRVPRALAGAVTGVVGLDTRPLSIVRPARASAAAVDRVRTDRRSSHATTPTTSAYTRRTGTPAGCPAALAKPGFTPNQYLTAYGFAPLQAAGLEGQGERVALIEVDGFKTSDVTAFARCYGLGVPKINAFGVGIKRALAPGGESTLDLELLDAAAPKLSAIDVYESEADAPDVLKSLTDPLSNKGHRPDVISASLGICEQATETSVTNAGVQVVEQSLQLAAATGISVLASSGDDGSTACVTKQNEPLDRLAVNFPASSPWVTGVGGTNVKLDAGNAIADPATDQVVWNDEPALLGAGGGGISMFKRPGYQNGFVSGSRREVPDVALLADPLPGYEIYCTARSECVRSSSASPWQNFGGTSAGTPLLAGGFALVDQLLRSRGQQNIGFANPLLYKIDRSAATAGTSFADVVTGSNDVSGSVFARALGCCSAAPGYDQASGLGSVNLQGFSAAAETLVGRKVRVSLAVPGQPRPVAARRFRATVSCTGTCLMGAYVRIVVGHRKPLTLYSRIYELSKKGSRAVAVALSAGQRSMLRTALADRERVTATLYGAIVDTTGAVQSRTSGRTLVVRG